MPTPVPSDRRTLVPPSLAHDELKAFEAAYRRGDVDCEPMLNLRMERLRENGVDPLPGIAMDNLSVPRLVKLWPRKTFRFVGNRPYTLVLLTDGETFGMMSQAIESRTTLVGPTRVEVVMHADLPFLRVRKRPDRQAVDRFRAAHLNWLVATESTLDEPLRHQAQRMARAMATGDGPDHGQRIRRLLDEGDSAEHLMGLAPLAPASSDPNAAASIPSSSNSPRRPSGRGPR